MRLYKLAFTFLLIFVFGGLLVAGAPAQTQTTGAVSGTVLDPGGAVVPGATLKLTNPATGSVNTVTTDNSGFYTLTLLKPGSYTISVEKAGFRKVESPLEIVVGQNVTNNFKLEVGNVSEVIQVESAPPQLQVENANLSTTFEAQLVSKLPNPGNDLTAVAQTAPGVLMNTSSGGGYGNFTAFGLPATANLFTMNGNDENDPYLNLNNSGATNLLLGTNEVQEVAVVSNGYTAQYGRQAGAQIDYVTKTGTNDFHGNAVYFYNNRIMNANDFFNNATNTPLPGENNNQWQASIGGPIKKDKIFFFVDYEGLRYVLGTSNQVIVPTPAFGQAVVNNLPSFGMNNSGPFYQNMFNLWDNAPGINRAQPVGNSIDGTGNLGCGDLNTSSVLAGFAQFGGILGGGQPCSEWFRSTVGALSREWILAGNVEFHPTDTDRINTRVRFDRGLQPTYTDPINSAFTMTSNQPQDEGQLNWNHIFSPTKTNQLILSGMYYSAIFGPQATAAQSVFPGSLIDLDTNSWAYVGGIDFVFPQGRNVSQVQVVDDFTWTKGNHTFHFGGNYRYNKISDYSNSEVNPELLIFSTTDFVEGVNDYIAQIHPQLTSVSIGIYSLGLYAQDEWRVKPNLKLTLALRADRNSNATCYQSCFSLLNTTFADLNHDPTVPYSQMINSGVAHAFKDLQPVVWEPRVGFAWTPNSQYWKQNSTVIRGGVGMFSDLYPGTLADNALHNSPSVNSFTLFGNPLATGEANNAYSSQNQCNAIFNGVIAASGTLQDFLNQSAAAGLPCETPNYYSVNNKIYNPTYVEWNLQVQHAITNSTMFSVNYVGNHGYNLFVTNPWVNAYGFGSLPATAPDPRVSVVQNLTNSGTSNYNGMTVSLSQRAWKGLTFNFNYTYSHTLDDVSNGGVLPYSLNNSYLVQFNPTSLANNYGNSDYDVRHNFSANYVWELPFKFSNRALETVAGGWQMAGTLFYRTGLPFSVVDGLTPNLIGNGSSGAFLVDPLSPTARNCGAAAVNNPCMALSNFPASGTETNFANATKNSYRGPGYFNTDFSLLKNFALTERLRFALGANFFNILNHPNFANPVSDISNGSFGRIIQTVVPPTSPYGAFVGSAVSGREVQVTARITF